MAAPEAAAARSRQLLRIGQLASRTGVTAKTLRYYEDIGLLTPACRSESGYRLYGDDAVDRLRFVRRSQGLGLRLDDIRQILEISDDGRAPCEHVIAVVDRQLEEITSQLTRLKALRQDLRGLRARLAEALETGSVAPGQVCPCFQDETAR